MVSDFSCWIACSGHYFGSRSHLWKQRSALHLDLGVCGEKIGRQCRRQNVVTGLQTSDFDHPMSGLLQITSNIICSYMMPSIPNHQPTFWPIGMSCSLCGSSSPPVVLAPVMVEQLEWTLQLPNGKEENFTGDAPKSIREVVLLNRHGFVQQMEGMVSSVSGSIFVEFVVHLKTWVKCKCFLIADSSIIQPESFSSQGKHRAGSWFLRWVPLDWILFSRLLGALHSDEAKLKGRHDVWALYGSLLHRQVKKTLQTGAISLAEVDSLLQRFHLLGHTGSDLGDTLKGKTKALF